jgi:short-subunit dehydrogenase
MQKYLLILFLLLSASAPAAFAGDKCALIAGGSRGIGYAIAEALAKRGWDLVLVARHMDDLQLAETRLEEKYHIQVDVLAKDLSMEDTPAEIAAWCKEKKVRLRMLCNVAGFGGARDYLQLPADTVRYMLRLNIESTVMLTYALLPMLEQNAPSYILNVASMAGLGPMPSKNIYSATKSAVIFFSYSLHFQLRKKDIHVSCLAPGPVYTKQEVINTTHKMLGKTFGDWIEVPPARVGELAVRKTLNGKMLIVPGTLANISSKLIRALPRRWVAAIYASGLN